MTLFLQSKEYVIKLQNKKSKNFQTSEVTDNFI